MRAIKFRGKDKATGKMVYGDLTHTTAVGEKENYRRIMVGGYEVDEETVGQFTGLCDKNGKDIYEGDIVKTPLLDPIFCDIIKDAFCNAEIKFNKGSFVVSYYKREHNIYLSDLYERIEVIGNIFDNKDLLEE